MSDGTVVKCGTCGHGWAVTSEDAEDFLAGMIQLWCPMCRQGSVEVVDVRGEQTEMNPEEVNEMLQVMDSDDDLDLNDWEVTFIGSVIGASHFTPRQVQAVLRMWSNYYGER